MILIIQLPYGDDTGKQILIADDDQNFLEAFSELVITELKAYKVNVNCIESGPGALTILKKNNIDILLLDFDMPKMDGIQVLNEISKNGYTVPVIAITAHEDMLQAMIDSGAIKAYHKEDLTQLLNCINFIRTKFLM